MATKEIHQVLEFPSNPEMDSEEEVAEWLEAFDQVVEGEGTNRGCELLDALIQRARESGVEVPVQFNTPYTNTIPVEEEVPYPGDRHLERRIKSLVRWNAMAMVHRQNKKDPGIGGHISTYSSLATLLEVGFNHFFRARYGDQPGDFIYFQGHSSPGVYARAYLGRPPAAKSRSRISATNCAARPDCRPIRIPGCCLTSGASPPSRWASVR